MPIIAGQITGSALSGSLNYTFLSNIPSGIVSGAAQVAANLPAGTVSSSGQIDYNSITNKLSGVVSSSTQVQPLLPGGTVSASNQVDITATTNYSTFSSSLATVDVGQTTRIDNLASLTSSYAINATIQSQLAGVVSSSTQVQPLLPGGTVSASGQVSITATSGYSTFSSSIATKNDTQDVSIGALNAATSSYAINATIQSQLASVVSSSTQVKPLLPGGTVSASGQVDITATTNYSTFSSSLATVDAGQTTRIDNLASLTSSYAINSTIQSQLANVVSSSTQVKPLLPGGTVSASGQIVVQNTTGIGALATTGSNVFTANQIITGSLFVSENLTVLGSSSISYISQSTLNVGTNVITMNTNTPGVRLGGIEVIDSGSSPLRSGSLYFDSINDQWIFVHQNTAGGTTSSVLLVGPATFNNIGNETLLTQNKVLKGAGLEHVTDSQITDNGVTVSITNGLSVGTNLTASNATITGLNASQAVFTDANDQLVSVATTGTGDVVRAGSPTITGTLNATNITATGTMLLAGILSQSSQVSITGTTGYSTFSSSIATKNDLQDISINALNAATSSYAVNSTIQGQLAGVASSSAQVKAYLPGGSVSSSAQYPGWVTASSQIDYNSITNKLSGVYSSSAFSSPSQGTARLTLNGTALADVDLGLQVADNVTFAQVTASNLTANQAVFTNASDGLVSNAITGTGNVVMSASPTLTGTLSAANITATGTMLLAGIVSQSSQIDYNSIQNKLSGVVSSSVQVQPLLPGGTVSSSAQYPGWVTASSQIDYNSITNKLSGVISSSTQFNALTNTSATSASFVTSTIGLGAPTVTNTTDGAGLVLRGAGNGQTAQLRIVANGQAWTDAINTAYFQVSSSTGNNLSFMGGTYGADAAFDRLQFNAKYAQISNHTYGFSPVPSYVFQVLNTTSSVVPAMGILGTGSANYLDITTSGSAAGNILSVKGTGLVTIGSNLSVGTSITASFISGALTGTFPYTGLTSIPSGIVSSSTQVQPLLPGGTVSASGQVDITATTNYSTFSSSLATVDIGQTTRIDNLASLTSSYAINSTIQSQLAGVVSSSTQVKPLLPSGTVSASGQVDVTATAGYSTFSSSLATVDVEQTTRIDNLASLTSSYAINATIQGQLANVVSSSTQVKPLLPGGTVSASGQVDITATTGYSTFSSSLATVDLGQTNRIDNLASLTSSYAINSTIQSQLAGVASSSSQVKAFLPADTVSSSTQVVAGVASQTIAPTNVNATNILSGSVLQTGTNALIGGKLAVTGSAEFTGTVTASNLTANQAVFTNASDGLVSNAITGTGNVVMSASPTLTGTLTAANITATGTMLLAGIISQSSQVDYNSITNKLSGVVSSSAQVKPLLPDGTVSSSAQYPGWVTASSQIALSGITGTTFAATDFTFPNNLTVGGTITAEKINTEYVSASVIFESGSSKFGDTADDVMSVTGSIRVLGGTISGSMVGMFSSSAQVDYNSITNKLSGVVSSSTQVKPLLPDGTVSSSGQVDYNSITNKLSGVVSSSTQIATLLPASTVSSSTQIVAGVAAQTIAPTNVNATNILSGSVLQTGTNALIGGKLAVTGSAEFTGTITASNLTANQAVFTNAVDGLVSNAITGTGNVVMSASPTLTGTLTAANITATGTMLLAGIVSQSSQIDYNSITNKLSGVYSSSTQAVAAIAGQTIAPATVNATSILSGSVLQTGTNALIGGKLAVTGALEVTGTVTASNLTANQAVFTNAVDGLVSNAITGTGNVVMSASPTITGTLTAANITATGTMLLAGIYSSSAQVDYNSITNKLSGVYSSSTQAVTAIAAQTIAPTTVNATSILSGSVLQTGTNALIGGKLAVTGALEVTGTVTASNLTANQAVFTNASDGLVSNAITGTGNVVMSASPTLTGTLTAASITANGTLLLQNIVSQSSAPSFTGLTSTGTVLLAGIYSSSAQTVAAIASQIITPSTVNATNVNSTAVTASGLTANQAVFTNGSDELVSNAITGTGNVVMSTSPTLVTPILGTPTSVTLTNATGLPVSTGISGLGTGVATFLATPSSANLAAALTDETGTGANVFAGSPTLTGTVTADKMVMSGSQFAGIVSGSGLQYRLVVPVGTNQYAT